MASFTGRGACARIRNEPERATAEKLYHLGGGTVSRSALSNGQRVAAGGSVWWPAFGVDGSVAAGYRRKIGDCVRLIDSTSVAVEQPERRLGDVFGGSFRRKGAHCLRSRRRPAAVPHGDGPRTSTTLPPPRRCRSRQGGDLCFRPRLLLLGGGPSLIRRFAASSRGFKCNTPFTGWRDRPGPTRIIDPERTGPDTSQAARCLRRNPMWGWCERFRSSSRPARCCRIFTN